jgi:hypothetical protein
MTLRVARVRRAQADASTSSCRRPARVQGSRLIRCVSTPLSLLGVYHELPWKVKVAR